MKTIKYLFSTATENMNELKHINNLEPYPAGKH